MKAILFLLAVGLGIFGFVQYTNVKGANETSEAAKAELVTVRSQLEESRSAVNTTKNQLIQATRKADELDVTKKQLAEAQAKVRESSTHAEPQVGLEDAKKQAAEMEELQKKAAASEEQLTKAKEDLATAQTQLANANSELKRLQQQLAKPALGTAMDKRR